MYSENRCLRRILSAVMCLFLVVTLSVSVFAAYPTHDDFISDPDNYLSDSTISAILSANDTLYKTKEVKIAVCLTDSTGGESIMDFSRTLFTRWGMCDGVLLVLDTTAQTYFAVQSVDVHDILTNTVLQEILVSNMEEEFSAGNIDRGVMKTVTALSQFMSANLPTPEGLEVPVTGEASEDGETAEEEPNGFVKFMRVVLWLLLIAFILGAGVFVLALYNEDVGDFLNTYIFSRNAPRQPSYPNRNDYYDERLYRNQGRNPQNPYNPSGRNGQYGRQEQLPAPRRQTRQDVYDPYDDYAMQYQQPRQRQQGQQRQHPGSPNGQGQYPARSGQRPQGSRPPQQGYNQGYSQGYGQPQNYNRQSYGSQNSGSQNYGSQNYGGQNYSGQGQRRPAQNGQNRSPRNY